MGYAVWDTYGNCFIAAGCITTSKHSGPVYKDNVLTIRQLTNRLIGLVGRYGINSIAGEFPTGGAKSSKAATSMATASAVVVSFALLQEIPLRFVTPNQIKRQVNPEASKAVSKDEVIAYASKRFGTKFLPGNSLTEHVADAMTVIDVIKASHDTEI
jgi:hypothetical protein